MIVLCTAIFLIGGIIIVDMERRENMAIIMPEFPLTLSQIKNAAVPWEDEKVQLVDGGYEGMKYVGKGDGEPNTAVSLGIREPVGFGDLNGDGVSDGAVILAKYLGGTGVFMSLGVFVSEAGEAKYLTEISLGDRIKVNSLKIEHGTIKLDMIAHGPNDGMCCPSMPKSTSYTLVGDKLVEGWSTYKNEKYGFEIKYESGWGECLPNKRYKEGEVPLMCIEKPHNEIEGSKTISLVIDDSSYKKYGGSYARLAEALKAEHERVLKLGLYSVFEEGIIGNIQFIRSGTGDVGTWGNYYIVLKDTVLEVRYANAEGDAKKILETLRLF